MKKLAVIALSLSLASTAVFAQTTPPVTPPAPAVAPSNAPVVVVAGGIGAGGIILGLLAIILLAGLGSGKNPTGDGGDGSGSGSGSE